MSGTRPNLADEPYYCPYCHAEMEWEDCSECHGEGGFDAHDDDPVNYAEGEEWERCANCDGAGGYLQCSMVGTQSHIDAVDNWQKQHNGKDET